jgi:hypothetical protein
MKKSSEALSKMQDRMASRPDMLRRGDVRIVPPPPPAPKGGTQSTSKQSS